MAHETRAGLGPIESGADCARFVEIMAGRYVRAVADGGSEHSNGRAAAYRQAIAEALGRPVGEVTRDVIVEIVSMS